MEIKTDRLTIKPIDLSYLHSTFEYAGNLENTKFMMFLPYDSVEETKEVLEQSEKYWQSENPPYLHFAILLEGRHIGEVSIYSTDTPGEGELGWVIHRDFWNRGYTTESACAVMDYAVNTLGLKRIIACCDSENSASYRVMEKLGMRKVSCLPGRKNRASDEERFELLYEKIF